MTRRTRTNSVEAVVQAAQKSQASINPPSNVPLADADLPFFASVIAEFGRSEWTAHQLELAALLAKKMRLLRDELEQLETEGFVISGPSGAAAQNPRLGGVRMLDTSIMATRRSMQIHARARDGEARDTAPRRDAIKSAEDVGHDDLLARPN